MAIRYIAVLCSNVTKLHSISRQISSLTTLRKLVDRDHLVFGDGSDSLFRSLDSGEIIGHVFTRSDSPRPVQNFTQSDAAAIHASAGDCLLTRFWGGYMALLKGSGQGAYTALRDPSGALPCYYLEIDDALILTSDIETAFDAGFLSPQLDWDFIGGCVLAGGPPVAGTAIKGFTELLAGWRLNWSAAGLSTSPWWSPWDHVSEIRSAESEAVDRLRSTVNGCVGAWGDSFRRPLLGVSGGLDSSIVAASLKATGTDVTCFTMATDEPFGDERSFARDLCSYLELGLSERIYDLSEVDVTQSTSLHLPRPGIPTFGQSNLKARSEIAEMHGCDAFISGVGGDNVFFLTMAATPIVDSFRSRGFSSNTWHTLNDICKLTRCSIWDAVSAAFARARDTDPNYIWKLDNRFLGRDRFNAISPPINFGSWLSAPEKSLPGKAVHVARIMGCQYPTDLFPRNASGPHILPLFSQPIMEFCLTIPTWQWCSNGQNRSLARKAFSDLLPPSIISRKSKGGPDSFAYDVALKNSKQIREHLLGGILAKQGVLDVLEIEFALKSNGQFGKGDHLRLLTLTEAESWARAWDQKSKVVHVEHRLRLST